MATNGTTSNPNPKTLIHTTDTFRPLLKKLTLSASLPSINPSYPPKPAGPALSPSELLELFQHLSDPNFTSSHLNHSQIGSALTSLRLTGLDSTSVSLACASQVFLASSYALHVPTLQTIDNGRENSGTEAEAEGGNESRSGNGNQESFKIQQEIENYDGALDLVGTGGDGHDTFNVSTTAAMVAAGVEGIRICKHGAKASSSTSGSADLLISLSIPLLSLTPSILKPLLPTCSFTFLFAQLFHPSLGPLGPIRRALGFPTIFNVLGPLINPAKPGRCILGVHSPGLGSVFADALLKKGIGRAWVVCGKEGLDEISCEGETDVWELRDGEIRHFTVSPSDFGLPSHPLSQVTSCSSNENASIVLHMLSSEEENLPSESLSKPLSLSSQTLLYNQDSQEVQQASSADFPTSHNLPPIPSGVNLRALADYTLLQTAALLYVGGKASNLKSAVDLARNSMRSGNARKEIEKFGRLSREGVRKKEEEDRKRKEEEKIKEFMKVKKERERERIRSRTESIGVGENGAGNGDQYEYYPLPTKEAGVGTD